MSADLSQLITIPGYDDLAPEQHAAICNGCGSKAAAVDLVPDAVLWADFTPACDRHDYEYWLGHDKPGADRRFLHNLLVCSYTDNKALYLLRARAAFAYFVAVVEFGASSFGVKN